MEKKMIVIITPPLYFIAAIFKKKKETKPLEEDRLIEVTSFASRVVV